MSLYYKTNEDSTLVFDTRKTSILIDSRNHISADSSSVKNSLQHFDNLLINVEPIYDVICMEITYYHLRFYDSASAYTNPYVNLYLSNYGKIVNNYDGQMTTFNSLQANLDRPFAILPIETSVIYPVGYAPGILPFNNTSKLNYESFPPNTALSYQSTSTIPNNFRMITEYSTPIDRVQRINLQLRDFQGRLLSETQQVRNATDTKTNYIALMLEITSKV